MSDEIAYNAHDLDDGVRSGLLVYEELLELPLVSRFHSEALGGTPGLTGKRLLYETLRRMLSALVNDLIDTSTSLVESQAPESAEAARQGRPLIAFSPSMGAELRRINVFLRRAPYRHRQVVWTTDGAKRVVRDLFDAYLTQPNQMPAEHAHRLPLQQAVVDYIAGMIDRFALSEHLRLTGKAIDLGAGCSA